MLFYSVASEKPKNNPSRKKGVHRTDTKFAGDPAWNRRSNFSILKIQFVHLNLRLGTGQHGIGNTLGPQSNIHFFRTDSAAGKEQSGAAILRIGQFQLGFCRFQIWSGRI
jgi:hypothetical protein